MSEKNLKFDGKHATKHNPNNPLFWKELGYNDRPENWKELYAEMGKETSSRKRQSRRDLADFYDSGCGPLSKDDY